MSLDCSSGDYDSSVQSLRARREIETERERKRVCVCFAFYNYLYTKRYEKKYAWTGGKKNNKKKSARCARAYYSLNPRVIAARAYYIRILIFRAMLCCWERRPHPRSRTKRAERNESRESDLSRTTRYDTQ